MVGQSSRRPTMRDVATEAGVSFKTVSRVVNGEAGVSDEVRRRVQVAIETLGYRPDDRARRLRQDSDSTGTIGFIMVDVANPFFAPILRGIEEIARTHDYIVLSGSNDGEEERERQLVEAFVSRRVDGLIIVPAGRGTGPVQGELDRGTPVVFVDLEPETGPVDLVRSDHYGGARLATEHLLAHGHRDIAFIGDDPMVFSASSRLRGFLDTMNATGIDVPRHHVITGRHTPETWQAIVRDYARRPDVPTAIFTAQNYVSIGAATALHELGLRHRIAHVGFDDIDLAALLDPGLTVVPQQPLELGRRAARLLFRRIGGERGEAETDVLPCQVVVRGSGEIRPA